MLHGDYMSVLEAKTNSEFELEAVRFSRRLGFNTVSVTLVVDQPVGYPEFFSVDNTPPAYRAHFMDRAVGRICPVSQHCKRSSLPLAWDQATYVKAGRADVWEMQAQYGYRVGMSTALHLPKGLHVMVGVDRDQSLPDRPAQLARMTADLQLFATYAQEVAVRLLLPSSATPESLSLTTRELECLKWTMEGKTAWEVGRILGIAENTVIRHTHHATQKLGCTSKHHAVVKALRVGLIS